MKKRAPAPLGFALHRAAHHPHSLTDSLPYLLCSRSQKPHINLYCSGAFKPASLFLWILNTPRGSLQPLWGASLGYLISWGVIIDCSKNSNMISVLHRSPYIFSEYFCSTWGFSQQRIYIRKSEPQGIVKLCIPKETGVFYMQLFRNHPGYNDGKNTLGGNRVRVLFWGINRRFLAIYSSQFPGFRSSTS